MESSTGRRFHSFNRGAAAKATTTWTTTTTCRSYIFIAWHGAYESTANTHRHTPAHTVSVAHTSLRWRILSHVENFLLPPNKRAAKRMRWEKDCLRRKEIYFSDILTWILHIVNFAFQLKRRRSNSRSSSSGGRGAAMLADDAFIAFSFRLCARVWFESRQHSKQQQAVSYYSSILLSICMQVLGNLCTGLSVLPRSSFYCIRLATPFAADLCLRLLLQIAIVIVISLELLLLLGMWKCLSCKMQIMKLLQVHLTCELLLLLLLPSRQ